MSRELMLLRHAKSSWSSGAKDDFDRPLNKRGRKNAPRVGRWLKENDLIPDCIISSPAKRTALTVTAVVSALGMSEADVIYKRSVYLADRDTLLMVLAEYPEGCRRGLLVGHNPGLEQLLLYLCGDVVPRTRGGKVLVTAAVARIAMPKNWRNLRPGAGDLIELVRPEQLG